MTREIKFKAMLSGMKFLSAPFDWYDLRLMPQAEFIVQSTGIKDKNGKEIYEGDILKGVGGQGEVIFYDGAFMGQYEDEDFVLNLLETRDRKLEIIGNIYENPDLLTN